MGEVAVVNPDQENGGGETDSLKELGEVGSTSRGCY